MFKALLRYRNQRVRIQVDDHFDDVIRISTVAVCNGQYFGGGMRVAPQAQPDDGLFEVVIVGDISKMELLRRVNAVYSGTHLEMAQVRVARGRRVVATPVDGEEPVLIDCDGEVAGCLPAVIEMQPGALCVQV
jgi:diacylglycerol kinase family enzyme